MRLAPRRTPARPRPRHGRRRAPPKDRAAPNTWTGSSGSASQAPKRPSGRSTASRPTSAPNDCAAPLPKFAKAKRIFAGTVSAIAKVARPAADRADPLPLVRRPTSRDRSLGRTAAALRADDVARFQRVWADFIHEANKANNVVVSFGFNYCNFKSTRFR